MGQDIPSGSYLGCPEQQLKELLHVLINPTGHQMTFYKPHISVMYCSTIYMYHVSRPFLSAFQGEVHVQLKSYKCIIIIISYVEGKTRSTTESKPWKCIHVSTNGYVCIFVYTYSGGLLIVILMVHKILSGMFYKTVMCGF